MDKHQMANDSFVVRANALRAQIKDTATAVKAFKVDVLMALSPSRNGEDRGEELSNLTLAYRHLEDASQRLGKAIQARDGGTSVYDRDTTVGA